MSDLIAQVWMENRGHRVQAIILHTKQYKFAFVKGSKKDVRIFVDMLFIWDKRLLSVKSLWLRVEIYVFINGIVYKEVTRATSNAVKEQYQNEDKLIRVYTKQS